jgi:hypothetical protein
MRPMFLGLLAASLLSLCGCGGASEWSRAPRFGEPGTAFEPSPPYYCSNPLYVVQPGLYNGFWYGQGCYCLVFVRYYGSVGYSEYYTTVGVTSYGGGYYPGAGHVGGYYGNSGHRGGTYWYGSTPAAGYVYQSTPRTAVIEAPHIPPPPPPTRYGNQHSHGRHGY